MIPDICRRNGGHSISVKCSILGGEPPQYPFYARQKELSEVESPVLAGIFGIDPEVLPKEMVISYSATSDEYIERYIFKHMHNFFSIKKFLSPKRAFFSKKYWSFKKKKYAKILENIGKSRKRCEKVGKNEKRCKRSEAFLFFCICSNLFLIYYAEKRAGCVV